MDDRMMDATIEIVRVANERAQAVFGAMVDHVGVLAAPRRISLGEGAMRRQLLLDGVAVWEGEWREWEPAIMQWRETISDGCPTAIADAIRDGWTGWDNVVRRPKSVSAVFGASRS